MDTYITVLNCHKETLTTLAEDVDGIVPDDHWEESDGIISYLFGDTELRHFEDTIIKVTSLGVPFVLKTKYDTHAITYASMFSDTGKHLVYHYNDSERSFDVEQLDEMLNGHPEQLVHLKELVAKAYEKTVYPIWENQEEYGKRYRAAVLIKSL